MKIASIFGTVMLLASFATAQTPAPAVVVQPAPAAVAPVAPQNPVAASTTAALKALQDLKATNDELLKKQAATLQQLDELQKAVEQLKVYSKRG